MSAPIYAPGDQSPVVSRGASTDEPETATYRRARGSKDTTHEIWNHIALHLHPIGKGPLALNRSDWKHFVSCPFSDPRPQTCIHKR